MSTKEFDNQDPYKPSDKKILSLVIYFIQLNQCLPITSLTSIGVGVTR